YQFFAETVGGQVVGTVYQAFATQTANDNSFGNDYIAGGPGDDMIFGQLGNDVIQGDGQLPAPFANLSAAPALGCLSTAGTVRRAGWSFPKLIDACRDSGDNLAIHPSTDNLGPESNDVGAGVDGSDYIEGGGGSDVIFGNQGQDDIVGGSSSLFS